MQSAQVKRLHKRESWNHDLNIPVDVGLFSSGTGIPDIRELPHSKHTPVKLGGLELIRARILQIRMRYGEHIFCMGSEAIAFHDVREENGEPVHYFSLYHRKCHFKLRLHALSFAWTLVGYDDADTA